MTHTRSSAPLRLVLAASLAALTLSACGPSAQDGSTDGGAEAPSDSPSSSPSSSPVSEDPAPGDSASATGGTGATSTGGGTLLVAGDTPSTTTAQIISVSNADGETDPRPVPVGDPASLDDFVAPLGADLGPRVRAAVRRAEVPAGQTLMAAVVAVGCDAPTGIELVQTFDGYEVTAVLPKSGVQCVVAATSVALFLVEAP
jgi:hypothetical protein